MQLHEFLTEPVQLVEIEYDLNLSLPITTLPDLEPLEWVEYELDTDQETLRCLALNVYHEARGSTLIDQVSTAHVVLNRVESQRWPDDICSVVYQPYQFSWTHDQISDIPREHGAWEMSKMVAEAVYKGNTFDATYGSTHYHATEVRPYWSNTGRNRRIIGAHIYMVAR